MYFMDDRQRNAFEAALQTGAGLFGLRLTSRQVEQFSEYYRLLERRNKEINLTAVTGEEDVVARHFLDSMALFRISGLSGSKVIDVGTGAGFPGVPLKIAEATIQLTLLDSQQKRVVFLRELCEMIGIEAECLHGRAEEQSKLDERRDRAGAHKRAACAARQPGEFAALCAHRGHQRQGKRRGHVREYSAQGGL